MTISHQANFTELKGVSVYKERFNLEEAAYLISESAGEDPETVLKAIGESVENGKLRVFRPGGHLAYLPKNGRVYYEEVFWDDLNKWLERNTRDLTWRFPGPSTRPNRKPEIEVRTEPFSNLPRTRDEWFEVIHELVFDYKNKYGSFPSSNQAWSELWSNPPEGYGISTGQDRYRCDALIMGNNSLNKNSLYKRFRRWTGKDK